jgi:Tol biopolymer transport system component/DNA-binding winged helix-turn-helix (wHTH) protein
MHTTAAARVICFGPFQLDRRTRELRKGRHRIRVPDQSMRILLALLDRAGDVVTREELAAILWPRDTSVDVEHGLNSAVRRLRDAIGDSVDRPVYIETVPRLGYRFIGTIEPPAAAAPAPLAEPARTDTSVATEPPGQRPQRDSRWQWWIAVPAIALLLAAAFAIDWRARRTGTSTATAQPNPVPLTFDGGLQTDPGFSPDGQRIVYASNHTGNFELYVRRPSGGEAVPIAQDPANDSQPDWSPDDRIVFRSERAGGGLFVVPAAGGGVTRISTVGFRPRWSPDGRLILFAGTVPSGFNLDLQVVDISGAAIGRWPGTALGAFGWQPRSQTVLNFDCLVGPFTPKLQSWDVGAASPAEWTVADDVVREFRAQRLEVVHGEKVMVLPDMSAVYFVGLSRGARALWRIDIDAAGRRVTSGPTRVTMLREAASASLSPDGRQIVFDGSERNAQVLSYQLDSGKGHEAPPLAMTPDAVHAESPTVSHDGRAFAFVRHRPGSPERTELVARGRGDSHERTIRAIEHPHEVLWMPRWNRDGTKLVYSLISSAGQPGAARQQLRLFDTSTGEDRPLTSPIDPNATLWFPGGWTPNDTQVVVSGWNTFEAQGGWQSEIALMPIDAAPAAERVRKHIMSADGRLYVPAISPDGRWIAFRDRDGDSRRGRVAVVSARGGDPSTWTFVPGDDPTDKPAWSGNGEVLYFLSAERGWLNVWGVRFDSRRGTAAGEPFKITNFDGPGAHILPNVRTAELSVGGGRLVVPVVRPKGGLWLLERQTR